MNAIRLNSARVRVPPFGSRSFLFESFIELRFRRRSSMRRRKSSYFFALFVIQNGADFYARFFLNGFKSRLGFFAKVLKFAPGFFADFVHLLALGLIQAQIVVKLIDISLCALRAIRWIAGASGGR